MATVVRAGISVALLAGFYVVALVQLGLAVLVVAVLVDTLPSVVAIKVGVPLFTATVGAVAVGVWRAFRTKPEAPRGLVVDRRQAPALWATVEELAREVGAWMPQEIRLVPEVNAAVEEQSRLLGLVGGRRYLYIGWPLVRSLTVGQLRAVLAHELGHYSRRHTRLAALSYRGRLVIAETVGRIGPFNIAGWVFRGYGALYVLATNAVVRRQEYEADEASVRVAGKDSAASVLRDLPVIDAAWGFFLETYVAPAMEYGYAPDDLFGGFGEMVAARKAELEELRRQEPSQDHSNWDTHPPIASRLAAIAALPCGPQSPDTRPAVALFPDAASIDVELHKLVLDVGDRMVLSWPQLTTEMMTADLQRDADRAFRAIARRSGSGRPGLDGVLDLIAAGRLADIAEPFFPQATRREAAPMFAEILEPLLRLAALRSGVAGWRHSWSGPAEFAGRNGQPLTTETLGEIAKIMVSPNGLAEARRRLATIGIDPAAAALVEQKESAIGADLIAGIANVDVGQTEYDLLLLDNGFVLVSGPGDADNGKRRLRGLVESAPPTELARRHWFLPYEEIASAEVTREVPTRASLILYDGRELQLQEKWRSEMITKESRDVLVSTLSSIDTG